MHFNIQHTTLYQYSTSVFPEPHHLYFYPHNRPYVRLIDFDLQVTPTPSGLTVRLDAENNIYHQCWFDDSVDYIEIKAFMELETTKFNPFDFLVEETNKTNYQEALKIYLDPRMELSESCVLWLNEVKKNTGNDVINFLKGLCEHISLGWDHTISYRPELLDPNECFVKRKGSCRDLSWMMIQMLRNLNLPARFVSGYSYNPGLEDHELHAWVEAWVTSAGWIGLEPSTGLFATEHFVPIATSYHPANTLPVQGTFRGEATSKMEADVNITLA